MPSILASENSRSRGSTARQTAKPEKNITPHSGEDRSGVGLAPAGGCMTQPGTTHKPTSLLEALDSSCTRWAIRPALVYDDKSLSYEVFRDSARSLAGAYTELGIKPGDRILCQLSNCPEYLIAVFGAWASGAVHAGIDRQS